MGGKQSVERSRGAGLTGRRFDVNARDGSMEQEEEAVSECGVHLEFLKQYLDWLRRAHAVDTRSLSAAEAAHGRVAAPTTARVGRDGGGVPEWCIRSLTKSTRLSLAEHLQEGSVRSRSRRDLDDMQALPNGRRPFGAPTHFVCYSQAGQSLEALVEALELLGPEVTSSAYFWLDIVSKSQHSGPPQPNDAVAGPVSTSLDAFEVDLEERQRVVAAARGMVLVCGEQWPRVAPLDALMCLFEIHVASRTHSQITLALSSGATSQVRGMVQNTSLYADVAACDLLSKTPRADTLRNAGSAAVANGEACSTGPRGRVPVQTALERLVLGDMDGWQHARAEQDWQRSLVLKSVMEDMAPCESTEATYEALDSVVRQAIADAMVHVITPIQLEEATKRLREASAELAEEAHSSLPQANNNDSNSNNHSNGNSNKNDDDKNVKKSLLATFEQEKALPGTRAKPASSRRKPKCTSPPAWCPPNMNKPPPQEVKWRDEQAKSVSSHKSTPPSARASSPPSPAPARSPSNPPAPSPSPAYAAFTATVVRTLQVNSRMCRHLDLSGCDLRLDSRQQILRSLCVGSYLVKMNLAGVGFSSDTKLLTSIIKNNVLLVSLNLSDNKLRVKGVEAVVAALVPATHTPSPITVPMREMGSGPSMLSTLALDNTHLCGRWHQNQAERVDGPAAIAELLKRNEHITSLSLRGNAIGPMGVAEICAGLMFNSTLTSLDLSRNHIATPYSVLAVQLSMKDHRVLRKGGIAQLHAHHRVEVVQERERSHAVVRDIRGFKFLAVALEVNSALIHLNLSDNGIGKEIELWTGEESKFARSGLNTLVHALRANTTLTQLDLTGNGISNHAFAAFGTREWPAIQDVLKLEGPRVLSRAISGKSTFGMECQDDFELEPQMTARTAIERLIMGAMSSVPFLWALCLLSSARTCTMPEGIGKTRLRVARWEWAKERAATMENLERQRRRHDSVDNDMGKLKCKPTAHNLNQGIGQHKQREAEAASGPAREQVDAAGTVAASASQNMNIWNRNKRPDPKEELMEEPKNELSRPPKVRRRVGSTFFGSLARKDEPLV